jgi:hypothetical protein
MACPDGEYRNAPDGRDAFELCARSSPQALAWLRNRYFVAVKGEVHIKAHLSGNLIHTPVEISAAPEYDANARAIFLHVSRTELPRDAARPMLSRFNAMLNPLATYIARNLADIIPAKRIKAETPVGALFLATVRSVRVDGDVVVVALHGYRLAAATLILMLCTLLSATWFFSLWHRKRT